VDVETLVAETVSEIKKYYKRPTKDTVFSILRAKFLARVINFKIDIETADKFWIENKERLAEEVMKRVKNNI